MIENLETVVTDTPNSAATRFIVAWRHLSSGLSYCVTVITFTLTVKFVTL